MSEKIKFLTTKQTQKKRSNKDTISVFSRPQCIVRTTGSVVMNKSIILTRIKSINCYKQNKRQRKMSKTITKPQGLASSRGESKRMMIRALLDSGCSQTIILK